MTERDNAKAFIRDVKRERKANILLKADLSRAQREYDMRVAKARAITKAARLPLEQKLGSFGAMKLWGSGISCEGKNILFSEKFEITSESEGEIHSNTITTGSRRPTLTRMGVGGLVAGPVGAAIGMASQKNKVRSHVVTQDDRSAFITVSSDNVHMVAEARGVASQAARQFVSDVLNASYEYDKRKALVDARLAELMPAQEAIESDTRDIDIAKKAIEQGEEKLQSVIDGGTDSDRAALRQRDNLPKNIRNGFYIAVAALVLAGTLYLYYAS